MKQISLTQGRYAIVDDADFDMVTSLGKWQYKNGYACKSIGTLPNRKFVSMHRILMLPKDTEQVDHINGNKLDNRMSNLRVCTHAQNQANRKVSKNNKSGYKGVWYDPTMSRKKRWVASIGMGGNATRLGRFVTKEEAAMVYNEAALRHKGKFARVNVIGGVSLAQ